MKRLFLILLITPFFVYSQDYEYKSEVIDAPGKTADEIYMQAKEWFALTFNSANDIIQMDERPDILIAKGAIPVEYVTISMKKQYTTSMLVNFTISAKFRDGRYRYDLVISNIESNISGSPVYPFTTYLNGRTLDGARAILESVEMYGMKITDKMISDSAESCKRCCDSTFKQMDSLIASLKVAIVGDSSDDNW